jgi:Bacteriocin-protection, YdeI or OmpD-Associated/Domain of unknown function (DUF1905)
MTVREGADKTTATRFTAILELAGKTATGVTVPPDAVEAIHSGRQPLVRVTIGSHTYRSKVAVRGGAYKVPVSAENRERAGVVAGDEVEVTLELDTEPREITVPPDLAVALEAAPAAQAAFAALSYSRQRYHVESVEGAKKPQTRARRVAKAVEALAA